jgi:hypothetical protein
MASGIRVGRLRFAAALSLVFYSVDFASHAGFAQEVVAPTAPTQEVVAPDEFILNDGPVLNGVMLPSDCGCNDGSGTGCGDVVGAPCDSYGTAVGCAGGMCGACEHVQYKEHCRGWLNAEFLVWHLNGTDVPPLITDSPVSTVPIDEVGELGDSTTRILFGNEEIGDDWQSGLRLTGGFWLDRCRTFGVASDFFYVDGEDVSYQAGPSPNRIITRPFFNTEDNEADAELVSVPNQLDGTVRVSADDEFQGMGITLSHCIWGSCDRCGCGSSTLKLLSGYRYYEYESDLAITENLLVLPNTTQPLVPGTTIFLEDRFTTRNQFHGGEIGLQGCVQQCGWWIDGLAKLAIGSNRRTVYVDGTTVTSVPNAGTSSLPGGLLTSEVTNIGRFQNRENVVIPEFRLGVGRALSCCCAVRLGWNVIIWRDVARAGSQLPPGLEVDPRNLPPVTAGGGSQPDFPFIRDSELIAHGLDASIQWTF